MTYTGYKQVLKFIGDSGRCYAIIKKEQPDVYVRVRNRLSGCDIMLVNGALSSKGNYVFMSMPHKGKANSILVHHDCLSREEKLVAHVVLSTKVYASIEHKQEILKRHRVKVLDKLAKEEGISIKGTRVPKAPTKDPLKTPKENYEVFLGSEYWRYVRKLKLTQSGNKCQICGSKEGLNVHHNSYNHHYKEHKHLEDLVVLCRKCHETFHQKLKD